ncbi:hypothetical protein [Bacillus pinisoli]|uniref:hypothetical protein n=1 Tax=Bacillus pinisoli TaxID=2901866 RepID=UPI001FF1A568|nr:hypothetical protein [Bacillus pinisoli]
MEIIQLGSLAILLKWLLLGVAVFIGLLFLKYYTKKSSDSLSFDLISNSVFWGFVVWKLSLLIIEPTLIINSPLSLLYFTGGSTGLLLAIIFSIVYVLWKSRETNVLRAGLFFSLVVMSGYHLLMVLFLDDQHLYHILVALGSILGLWYIKTSKIVIKVIIYYSFLRVALLLALVDPNDERVFIFTFEQWFFVAIILVLLIFWERLPIKNENLGETN